MKRPFRTTDCGFWIWGALLAVVLLTMPVWGTTVMKMELPELVKTADSIVQGRVEAVEARWERKLIFTYVSIIVDDPLKGDRKQTVLVRQLGGKIGALNMSVSGTPIFHPGDQVIVFLKAQRDGTFDIVGFNQGKYEIHDNFAVTNVSGMTLVDPRTGQLSDAGFAAKAPLETFKTKIRELLR